jgi:YHS domain-containing protein
MEQTEEKTGKVRDLVCGMYLDKDAIRSTDVYKGKTYYFCSNTCKKEFESAPQRYAKQEC